MSTYSAICLYIVQAKELLQYTLHHYCIDSNQKANDISFSPCHLYMTICNCNNAHNLFKGSARLLLGLHIKYQIHLCITYYFGSAQQIWCLTLELMLTVFQTLTFLLILSNIWLWQKIVRFWYSQIGCKYQITLMSYHVYKICRLLLTSYGLCQFQYRLCTC